MNGIHDMGGMHGFGPVEIEEDEPVFHAPWEGRVFGMSVLVGTRVANIDAMRHAIERIDPLRYLSLGYYGRWLASLEDRLEASGVLAEGELEARAAGLTLAEPDRPPPALPPPVLSARRDPGRPPRFSVGDRVRARNHQPSGHTRLPGYVRGKRGRVERVQGGWVFPDTNAHGQGEQPQHVYCVCFDGRTLWGEGADPRTDVRVDLFESYLEPAT